jgi:hypothetical protein
MNVSGVPYERLVNSSDTTRSDGAMKDFLMISSYLPVVPMGRKNLSKNKTGRQVQ